MRNTAVFQVKGTAHNLGLRTWLMGIINVTPDSFFDGGRYLDPAKAIEHGLRLADEGADILDIGGESTRPGSDPIPADEEARRVIPVVAGLRRQTDRLISVDTSKLEVAQAALDEGADMINDISAFSLDPRLIALTAQKDAGFIIMHMKGTPKTMQVQPHYEDVVGEVRSFLADKIEIARAYGLSEHNIVLDPGIGFGKRLEDNLALVNRLDALAGLGRPILLGVSRKSFIGKIIDAPAHERLEGTIAAAILGVVRGAHILRVHDVKALQRAVRVAEAILGTAGESARKEEKADYVH